jgi:CRP/FNR family transcriptional regulator
VISRQLKEFERRGWIRLGRGQLQLLDAGALQQLTGK